MKKKEIRERSLTETELEIDGIEINVIHQDTDIIEICIDGCDIYDWLNTKKRQEIETELERAIINEDEIDYDKAHEQD